MPDNLKIFIKQFIEFSDQLIFLTGKAGTGKTTLLNEIALNTNKNFVILASTGIAALNAGGSTIHSFLQLPFASFIPSFEINTNFDSSLKFENKNSMKKHYKMHQKKKNLIRALDLIIIDEVSMLRSDLLDEIDWVLRNIRNKNKPFGGIQMLFIGDLYQLPPVVKNEEWQVLKKYYEGIFFFQSLVLKENPPLHIELKHIYRQNDIEFIDLLNKLRNNILGDKEIELLNSFYSPNTLNDSKKGYITLTTHNYKAQNINNKELESIKKNEFVFNAEVTGDFHESIFPIDFELKLKIGSQVMFVKNDPSGNRQFYNGKIGQVFSLSFDEIIIYIPEENKYIELEKFEWENIRYSLNETTNEIEENVIGTFVQYPIKLAWAITIHKSQGLTFDKAIMDISEVFASGQAYVALSRLRSIAGLKLLKQVTLSDLKLDYEFPDFSNLLLNDNELKTLYEIKSKNFIFKKILKNYSWIDSKNLLLYVLSKIEAETKQSELDVFIEFKENIVNKWNALFEHSNNFVKQIEKIFKDANFSKDFVFQRIKSAHNYYITLIKPILSQLYTHIEIIKRTKPSKSLKNEYVILEEFINDIFVNFFKNNFLVINYCLENIDDFVLNQFNINSYFAMKDSIINDSKLRVIEQKNEIKEIVSNIVEKKEYPLKVKSPNSLEKTFDLFKQNKSIKEIALERTMAESTISDHVKKLISNGSIKINEVLSKDLIENLTVLFKNYNSDTTISQIKNETGESYSWEELKFFKAHFKTNETTVVK